MDKDKTLDETSKYLKLLVKDVSSSGAIPSAIVKVNDLLTIVITIDAKNITKSKVSILYDPIYFFLKTPSVVWLPEGSYSKDIEWKLQSLKKFSEPLWVEITVEEEEGGLVQAVDIPITFN